MKTNQPINAREIAKLFDVVFVQYTQSSIVVSLCLIFVTLPLLAPLDTKNCMLDENMCLFSQGLWF